MMTFGRIEVEQLLEAVVAVDQTAVEVVQIARREVARVEQHERAQVRRNDRDDVQHHELGVLSRVAQHLDRAQALDDVLHALLRARGDQLFAQFL
jgi:hypothetical protein